MLDGASGLRQRLVISDMTSRDRNCGRNNSVLNTVLKGSLFILKEERLLEFDQQQRLTSNERTSAAINM